MTDPRRCVNKVRKPHPAARAACRRLALGTLLASLIAAMGAPIQAADPTSIRQFNAQSSKWPRLVGTRLTLEGRCAGLSEDRLLMTKCDLVFEFADDVVVPRKPPNVVVVGHLEERGSRIRFVVTSLFARPSDRNQLAMDRSKIDVNRADDWYALAEWARERGAYYQDDELDAEATDLYRQGLHAEYRRLPVDESTGLVALAEKTGRFGLPQRLRMELLHESVSRELDDALSDDNHSFDIVMTHALERLPGARIPLLKYDEQARQQQAAYLESARDTYAAAEDEQRPVLERLLYIKAALARIERDVADDGHNGFDIAERIEASVPEIDELPEEYRQREIRWQTENVSRATREQMLVLVDRLEDRDQESQAIDVRRKWLEAREARLNRAGLSGQLELAEEYIDLLGDEQAAVDIYQKLYRAAESQTIAADRLQLLGYTFDGEDWQSGPLPDDTDELSMAIRNGSVRADMTEADVRAALGRPETTLRFASRGQIVELWVYPGPGISIHFARRNAGEEQIVIEVFNLPAHTRERLRQ